ncbi:YlzJ-like family protein [Radiobacillus sp. PE A8.2]|uniref:YlzJ-like family protein n=1 Tax=Radiobacillus sp. PE A8.2 TaxID=3380349 RepID=UPI00388E0DE4
MILYTPLSEHDIFPTESTHYDKCETIAHNGKMLQVERLENGTYKVMKLLSTDPQDFLDNRYCPGEIISG